MTQIQLRGLNLYISHQWMAVDLEYLELYCLEID
jgi:hypothetical protein